LVLGGGGEALLDGVESALEVFLGNGQLGDLLAGFVQLPLGLRFQFALAFEFVVQFKYGLVQALVGLLGLLQVLFELGVVGVELFDLILLGLDQAVQSVLFDLEL
jgi:hypothetical protein